MRRLLKAALWTVGVLGALALLLLALRNPIARAAVETAARRKTGLPFTVGGVDIGLRPRALTVTDVRLQNSPEFGGGDFLRLPEIRVEYAPGPQPAGSVHLRLLRLNLGELRVVERADGRNNVQDLAERLKRNQAGTAGTNTPGRSARPSQFPRIDTLSISLGHFSFTSAARPALTQELSLNLTNETVTNVRSSTDLAPLLTSIVLKTGAAILGRLLDEQNALTNRPPLLPQLP